MFSYVSAEQAVPKDHPLRGTVSVQLWRGKTMKQYV
jgi:hypothetical protein